MKREVPEVAAGSVIIDKIVREPGSRAKISVSSKQSGIDPVGSCVGQKGVRIQAVIDALDGLEKIDVIQGSSDPVKFITNALSPAKNLEVVVDEKEKIAHVTAPKEEMPLVIGRDGQNVRLAGKLTGYNLGVKDGAPSVISEDVEEAPEEEPAVKEEASVSQEETPEVKESEPEKASE